MPQILRLTLLKVANAETIQQGIQKYSTLTQDAKKDGKPYITMATAKPALDDPRSQGYNMVIRTVFESKEDVEYYDNECEAHAAIKALLKPNVSAPPLVVSMDSQA